MVTILQGDCREVLKTLPDKSVHCCVTSPPYWGLRDYGCDGQLGLEKTPEEYVANLVAVFRKVRRVLRDDGTLWLNLGDSYSSGGRTSTTLQTVRKGNGDDSLMSRPPVCNSFKPKDLVGIPWMVAFALRADGWYLRQDIIWHKPNPMPESVTDRCTKAHEYIFLLSKSAKYWYDAEAINEQAKESTIDRCKYNRVSEKGRIGFEQGGNYVDPKHELTHRQKQIETGTRNKRSVWTVATQPYKDAHFATFPPALITPCILAGCPQGGTVIDPFGGSGTVGEVAEVHGRNSILAELKPEYCVMAKRRTQQQGLFTRRLVKAGKGWG